MANFSGGAKTICPYYVKEADQSITCEGVIPGTNIMMRFPGVAEKNTFQGKYCSKHDYLRCPQAAILEKFANSEEKFANSEEKFANSEDLGTRIAEQREKRGFKQYHLAKRAFISESYLSEIEHNKKNPSYNTLLLICEALQINISVLSKKGAHNG
jgi:ribosome-binding protein aMBF1 (putative translation factor)